MAVVPSGPPPFGLVAPGALLSVLRLPACVFVCPVVVVLCWFVCLCLLAWVVVSLVLVLCFIRCRWVRVANDWHAIGIIGIVIALPSLIVGPS